VIGIGITIGAALVEGVGVGVGVAEGVGIGVAEGVGVGVAEGVGVGVGLTIATPLFHSNFFPDLTQVNFIPATTEVAPAFVQGAPADGEAAETEVGVSREATKMVSVAQTIFLMGKSPLYFGGGP